MTRHRITLQVTCEITLEVDAPTAGQAVREAVDAFLARPEAYVAGRRADDWAVQGARGKKVEPE